MSDMEKEKTKTIPQQFVFESKADMAMRAGTNTIDFASTKGKHVLNNSCSRVYVAVDVTAASNPTRRFASRLDQRKGSKRSRTS